MGRSYQLMSFSKANKSGIFLLELLLSILLFAVASTICIQIFAKSHVLSADAVRLDHSVSLAQSIASCIQSGITAPEELPEIISGRDLYREQSADRP